MSSAQTPERDKKEMQSCPTPLSLPGGAAYLPRPGPHLLQWMLGEEASSRRAGTRLVLESLRRQWAGQRGDVLSRGAARTRARIRGVLNGLQALRACHLPLSQAPTGTSRLLSSCEA